MGIATLIFGEQRRDVVGYHLSVDDLARTHLPDSKLAKLTAEFTRRTPVGVVGYSFDYNRDTIVKLNGGHTGPYVILRSYHMEPPLFAHAFKPTYIGDFYIVERAVAESVGGVLGTRHDYEMERRDGLQLDFFRYILLSNPLTREDFVKLLRNSGLKAENAKIKFIRFADATRSDYQFQVKHESKFHW